MRGCTYGKRSLVMHKNHWATRRNKDGLLFTYHSPGHKKMRLLITYHSPGHKKIRL